MGSNIMANLIVQCCVCGQIRISDDPPVWDGVKRPIIRKMGYSHGYCNDCFISERKKIRGEI